jgi:hypothetical protein
MNRVVVGGPVAASLLFATLAMAQPAPPRLEESEPLALDGSATPMYEHAPVFDLREGTVELWLAPMWEEDPGFPPCILANRDAPQGDDPGALAAATRYSFHVTGARDAVMMWNGVRWSSLPFDFRDERLHHVVFVTEGDETGVYVDGESRGTMPIGYGSGTGLPLHVGSADGTNEPFLGALWAVRIWDTALSEEALRAVENVLGVPELGAGIDRQPIAVSSFTTADKRLLIRSDAGEASSDEAVTLPLPLPPSRKR